MEEYNFAEYPKGYEEFKKELIFLPDDENVKELFMTDLLQFLIQW